MKFSYTKEFEKELKKLSKKYHSIKRDFSDFCEVLEIDPQGKDILENTIERISGLGKTFEDVEVFKVRKFSCESIKKNSKNSGIRIIYKYSKKNESIEFEEIEFLEIYHKNNQTNHSIERIKKHLD